MGLDVGERRIGVALSDPGGTLATPLSFLKRRSLEEDVARVLELAREHQVERIVVGLPLTLRGEIGPQARRVLVFCEALKASSPVPVETWDERLSTFEAERLLRGAGVKPSRQRGRSDAAAAAIILQGFLDSSRSSARE